MPDCVQNVNVWISFTDKFSKSFFVLHNAHIVSLDITVESENQIDFKFTSHSAWRFRVWKKRVHPEDTHENIKFHMPIVFRFMSDSSTVTDISATAAASSSLVVWISESMFTLHINTWGILMEILYFIRNQEQSVCALCNSSSQQPQLRFNVKGIILQFYTQRPRKEANEACWKVLRII